MTWYFLVMASVAVAAVLAGFCMGRLSGGSGVVPETGVEGAGGMEFGRDRKGADDRPRMAVAGLWGLRDRNAGQAATGSAYVQGQDSTGQGGAHVQRDAGMPGNADMASGAGIQGDAGIQGNAGTSVQRSHPGNQGSTVRSLGGYTRQPDRRYPDAGYPGASHIVRNPADGNRPVGNQPGNVWQGRNRTVRNHPGLYQIRRGRGRQATQEECTWSVGSPVSGEVAAVYEGEHPAVQILPMEDRLCAPVGGKVVDLFPMGNGLLFCTDFGTELCIQVGNSQDELLGRHYRPRVVKNEIVGKGKVLLQFDRKGLVAEGVSPMVTVSVANCAYGSSARPTDSEWVSSGEEILKVQGLPE